MSLEQYRQMEEDQLRREKLRYYEAARTSRNEARSSQNAEQNAEIAGWVMLGVFGAFSGILYGLFGTKIGRIITLVLLLAGGAFCIVYGQQIDAAIKKHAQQSVQKQEVSPSKVGSEAVSNSENAEQVAAQKAAVHTASPVAQPNSQAIVDANSSVPSDKPAARRTSADQDFSGKTYSDEEITAMEAEKQYQGDDPTVRARLGLPSRETKQLLK